MVTSLELALVTARSSKASALKRPTATAFGLVPTPGRGLEGCENPGVHGPMTASAAGVVCQTRGDSATPAANNGRSTRVNGRYQSFTAPPGRRTLDLAYPI